MKAVKYCDTLFEAEVIKGRLENEGITAFIANELINGTMFQATFIDNMKPYVYVADHDYEEAISLLGEEASVLTETKCPGCGSKDIKFEFYYKNKRQKAPTAILMPVLVIVSGIAGRFRRNYHCRHCGEWF